ncbi:MAG: STAS/SEC14 domain-containing protein [Gammaproteobacteria bacterium]
MATIRADLIYFKEKIVISYNLDENNLLLYIQPKETMKKEDFKTLSKAVDPLITKKGDLKGIIIESESFPGLESLGDLIGQFKFGKNQHTMIKKVALVTDAQVKDVAEKLGSHFLKAQVKQFHSGQVEGAKDWIGQ